MIFTHGRAAIEAAERLAGTTDVALVLHQLRRLPVMDFGLLLLSMPNVEFPNLSRILPRMASPEVERSWAGNAGYDLFRKTYDFILRLQYHFERLCRRPLEDSRILDFGVGYGRLFRLMPHFSDPANLYGVDPWDRAISICREDGLLGNLAQSDFLPTTLPVGQCRFDLIYAYSVFTHTSERATRVALETLRRYVRGDGLLVVTVRPVEFWDDAEWMLARSDYNAVGLRQAYDGAGFSYLPGGNFPLVDGEDVYGNCTIRPEWFERACPMWRLRGYDRGEDWNQMLLLLTPT